MRLLLRAIALVGLAGAGCAGRAGAPAPPSGPVLVELIGARETIIVSASPEGPRYSVVTPEGAVLVAGASEAELRSEHPRVYERIRSAIAAGETRADISVD